MSLNFLVSITYLDQGENNSVGNLEKVGKNLKFFQWENFPLSCFPPNLDLKICPKHQSFASINFLKNVLSSILHFHLNPRKKIDLSPSAPPISTSP